MNRMDFRPHCDFSAAFLVPESKLDLSQQSSSTSTILAGRMLWVTLAHSVSAPNVLLFGTS